MKVKELLDVLEAVYKSNENSFVTVQIFEEMEECDVYEVRIDADGVCLICENQE